MAKLELVIFDMDGLMFDTERIAFTSWKKAASEYGYEIDRELFIMTLGVNLEGTKEIFVKHFGEKFPIDSIKNERFKIAENIIKEDGVPVKKGLYELLNYLKEVNIKRAVATSTNRERAVSLLKKAGIDKCFDYVICGDDIKHSKPHPEIFLKAAEKLGCLPQHCIVLEDSEAGIISANRAKMVPIMVPDMKEPDEEIKKIIYKQLKSLYDVKLFIEDFLINSNV